MGRQVTVDSVSFEGVEQSRQAEVFKVLRSFLQEEKPETFPFHRVDRQDIDELIGGKLAAAKLTPSPEAATEKLIRRVSLDLIGLPPTPEQIESFLKDNSKVAFEKVVDELLASPRYGEKWARHWLDVARYAESGEIGRAHV